MRGPYDTPKRSHVIKTRLDDDEYEFFLRKCQVYGMNQSEMIRSSLDKLVINPVIKFSSVNKESCQWILTCVYSIIFAEVL